MSNILDPDQAQQMSSLIWVKSVCKQVMKFVTTRSQKVINQLNKKYKATLKISFSI